MSNEARSKSAELAGYVIKYGQGQPLYHVTCLVDLTPHSRHRLQDCLPEEKQTAVGCLVCHDTVFWGVFLSVTLPELKVFMRSIKCCVRS